MGENILLIGNKQWFVCRLFSCISQLSCWRRTFRSETISGNWKLVCGGFCFCSKDVFVFFSCFFFCLVRVEAWWLTWSKFERLWNQQSVYQQSHIPYNLFLLHVRVSLLLYVNCQAILQLRCCHLFSIQNKLFKNKKGFQTSLSVCFF